jgi:hypothetical protein
LAGKPLDYLFDRRKHSSSWERCGSRQRVPRSLC